jgi:hypothetical protein
MGRPYRDKKGSPQLTSLFLLNFSAKIRITCVIRASIS